MTLYRDRYRIPSARLHGWDYASAGCYFVTVCTINRACTLGSVGEGGVMVLSEAGRIVVEEWLKTEQVRKNVILDEWVIMPNHFHAIIFINDVPLQPKGVETPRRGVSDVPSGDAQCPGDVPPARLYENQPHAEGVETPRWGVSGVPTGDVQCPGDVPPARLYGGSLGAIVGQFKSAVTKRIRTAGLDFAWQSRYHDRIVRDDRALAEVREYIRNNPLQWHLDRENPECDAPYDPKA